MQSSATQRFRVVSSQLAGALFVPPLVMLTLPLAAAIVTGPFMYIDAGRARVPDGPRWSTDLLRTRRCCFAARARHYIGA